MKQKAVIFDMDGVICHTNPFHSKAFRIFFEKRGLKPTDEEFAQHMFGKSNRYIFNHFFNTEVSDEELLSLENEKEGLFREIYAEEVEPIAKFMEWLSALKSGGFKTGVATSAPRANLDLIMGKLGFESDMESILASEDVIMHKPDPEVYLKSAANLGVEPEQCLVFEDSFSGVSAGINAGMKVVGVLSSHSESELPPCHFYIQDYREIDLNMVNELWA
ncbi:HAD family phosphatase [Marinilongibacter aquaticus]|uniref:HAD family hydrolase n=1 Tax=Marinilongibacter aquaticus TaxID=2975157 RepID=UPI0021BD4BF9|nr:HAD family phosphatase [Marinilongibacter aquaticus]UBM60273.1 HAD family phosphatase [Marinilongibacter aquaticus]